MTAVIEVTGLAKRFGGLRALEGVTFAAGAREIFGIIGPNGAGKTTLFNVVSGALRPSGGRVVFEGRDISGWPCNRVAQAGLVRTFQNTTLFSSRTVLENLRTAKILRQAHDPWTALRRTSDGAGSDNHLSILKRVGMLDVADRVAGTLPYGLQKRLGLAIALVARPRVLLLDEPAAGLNPTETVEMAKLIRSFRDDEGIGVVLVEHDMQMVMSLCDRILVLNYGTPLHTGTPDEVKRHPAVIDAYLGADLDLA